MLNGSGLHPLLICFKLTFSPLSFDTCLLSFISHLLPRIILSTSEEACCREKECSIRTAWARPPQPIGNMAACSATRLSFTQHKPNSKRRLKVEGRITSAQSLHRAYTNILPQKAHTYSHNSNTTAKSSNNYSSQKQKKLKYWVTQ